MRLFTFLSLLLVSACGISPLYLTQGQETTNLTAAIEIQPIADYEGYLLQNYLSDRLNPKKMVAPKKISVKCAFEYAEYQRSKYSK